MADRRRFELRSQRSRGARTHRYANGSVDVANPGGYDPLADGLKGRCLTTLLYARGPFDPVYDRRPLA